jgi:fatty acid desaturase
MERAVNGDDSESMHKLRVDVTTAVRRVERRLAVRLVATWVTVLALTAGLVTAGVLARGYIQSLTSSWRPLLVSLLWLLVAIGIFLIISLAWPAILNRRPKWTPPPVRHHSWLAVVRRFARRFALGDSSPWLRVLAVTAVLVTAGIVALWYVRWSTPPSQLGSPSAPLLLVGAVALLAGALARMGFRGWRTSRDQRSRRRPTERPDDIRAEPHTRPVQVTVEYVRDGTRTFTVRVEPHADPGTQTLQEG